MQIPERKFHLYLEKKYREQKELAKMGSLPSLTHKQYKPFPSDDVLKDSVDFLSRINLFVDGSNQRTHKSEPTSMHTTNPLVDFASYRRQMFERLNNRVHCPFKFEEMQEEIRRPPPKQEKAVTKSCVETSVPQFLTTLLKTTFHREKNVRKRLQKKSLLHVEQIVSKRKERIL